MLDHINIKVALQAVWALANLSSEAAIIRDDILQTGAINKSCELFLKGMQLKDHHFVK
jgi:hypothetical protein